MCALNSVQDRRGSRRVSAAETRLPPQSRAIDISDAGSRELHSGIFLSEEIIFAAGNRNCAANGQFPSARKRSARLLAGRPVLSCAPAPTAPTVLRKKP